MSRSHMTKPNVLNSLRLLFVAKVNRKSLNCESSADKNDDRTDLMNGLFVGLKQQCNGYSHRSKKQSEMFEQIINQHLNKNGRKEEEKIAICSSYKSHDGR